MASNTSSSRYSGNGESPWLNDPNELDPARHYGTPPDPAQARAARRSTFASLGSGISPEANAQLKIILGSLGDMEATLSYPYAYIRNILTEDQTTTVGIKSTVTRVRKTNVTSDQRANAQASLTAQRQIVEKSTAAAKAAFDVLKPRVLGDVVAKPANMSDAQLADRKADLVAAISAAGKIAGNPLAQQLIRQAVTDGDQVTIYVLCGDPLKFRAADLGLDQMVLCAVYAEAQMLKVGPKPLDAIGNRLVDGVSVPGGALIQALPDLSAFIGETSTAVSAALNALAKECGLQ